MANLQSTKNDCITLQQQINKEVLNFEQQKKLMNAENQQLKEKNESLLQTLEEHVTNIYDLQQQFNQIQEECELQKLKNNELQEEVQMGLTQEMQAQIAAQAENYQNEIRNLEKLNQM